MLANRVRIGSRKKYIDEVYLAQDNDFSGTTNGSFRYIGTELELKIPHIIKSVAVTSYSSMFEGTNVTKVVSDNPNVTNMSYMFRDSQATSLDLSSFNTSKVTIMSYCFRDSQATTLDLSSFNTSNVTGMTSMFQSSNAVVLDLSSFDTSKATNMASVFRYSQATTGYARTQADADKLNGSSGKPSTLTFVVK